MRPPFPGMDPWLEHPSLWPDVHNSLIVALRDNLAPILAPRYYISLQERIQMIRPDDHPLIGIPDLSVIIHHPVQPASQLPLADVDVIELDFSIDEVHESYLEIFNTETREVVTVVEVLSPINKQGSKGRAEYENKRDAIFASLTNFVEIDLLRAGKPMPMSKQVKSDYRIMVLRGIERRRGWLYPFSVRKPIPPFPLPLLPGDITPTVDLNALLHSLYDRAHFDLQIDYTKPPAPPLNDEDSAWALEVIKNAQ